MKDRFCPTHADQDLICVVTSCVEYAEEGHRTCRLKEHRDLENYNSEKNRAMFQLKDHLAQLRTLQPRESIPVGGDDTGLDEEVILNKNSICDGKPEEGNQTLQARFGQKRTHNEELCITSCGIILGGQLSMAQKHLKGLWYTNFHLTFIFTYRYYTSIIPVILEEAISDQKITALSSMAQQ